MHKWKIEMSMKISDYGDEWTIERNESTVADYGDAGKNVGLALARIIAELGDEGPEALASAMVHYARVTGDGSSTQAAERFSGAANELGLAYRDWTGEHEWPDCVQLKVHKKLLRCNEGDELCPTCTRITKDAESKRVAQS